MKQVVLTDGYCVNFSCTFFASSENVSEPKPTNI